MKLTPRQVLIRKTFRKALIECWDDPDRPYMFSTAIEVAKELDVPFGDAISEMSEIPSIGKFNGKRLIREYLAYHYRPISDALFDGKSKERVMKMWATTKKGMAGSDLRARQNDYAEFHSTKKKRVMSKQFSDGVLSRTGPESSNWRACK